jgi:hypothetical protein
MERLKISQLRNDAIKEEVIRGLGEREKGREDRNRQRNIEKEWCSLHISRQQTLRNTAQNFHEKIYS